MLRYLRLPGHFLTARRARRHEIDDRAAPGERSVGRREEADDAQAALAAGRWHASLGDGADELGHRVRQGLADLEVRRPHVALAEADVALVLALSALVARRPRVVDPQPLARLEIVPEGRAPAAAEQRPTQLDRREPVDMQVGDEAAGIPQGDEGDVFPLAGEMRRAVGGDRRRRLRRQPVEDGKVVDREVPEHVDVALKAAEGDAHRVEVAQRAQLAGVDQLTALMVFEFAAAAGDRPQAWSALSQLEGPLRRQVATPYLDVRRAYRDAWRAQARGDFERANGLLRQGLVHRWASDGDKRALLLFERRAAALAAGRPRDAVLAEDALRALAASDANR